MRYLAFFLSLCIFVFVGALSGAPNTNAVSEYDETLQISPTPYVISSDLDTPALYLQSTFEVGEIIAGVGNNSTSNNFCGQNSVNNRFPDVIEHIKNGDRDYVIQSDTRINSTNNLVNRAIRIKINMQDTQTSSWGWQQNIVFANYINSDILEFTLMYRTGTQQVIACGSPTENINSMTFAAKPMTGFSSLTIIETNMNIDYPDNYEGIIIAPVTPTEPPIYLDYTPTWYVSTAKDYIATIHDSNFNTFDGNPFLCEGDLAPVLYYEIYDITDNDNHVKLTDGVQSATAQIMYQLPISNSQKQYRVLGWYDCGDGSIFTENSFKDFTITKDGNLGADYFEACIKTEFPYIDPDACLENIYTIINLLTFNQITFGQDWSSPDGCRYTVRLHEWLNLPSQNICPQFSPEVRNIVTPFITLILGFTAMFFLIRTRDDY